MANLTPLRNIHLSGGLFTENLLLKIRDKKDQIPEVQWSTFGEKWQEEKTRYYEVWDWAKRLFGEIVNKIDIWTIEDRFEKWINPLLQKLGHESRPKPSIDLTILSEEDQDNILNRIQISHQLKNHAEIGLHICEDDNFDERNDTNYQKKSQHDHFQRFILLNEGVRWGLLSNGKHVRLLGEYSNIYAKGYVQFNLDSIFINKDESEFWIFYALIHHSRFNETFGLNPGEWVKKLEKKWADTSEKLSKDGIETKINLISEDILSVYKKILIDFIQKADNKGVMAVTASDSEIFMQNLLKKELDIGEIGRDFYLKELDSVISTINDNLSIIQRLQKKSQEEGIEAGKKLRENVKNALELMGEGLINSSKNFTGDILKGKIEIKVFYQELLRITYRIIFILYAEAKDLLPEVSTIYYNDLGLTYIRKKAQEPIRDDQNIDLWYRLLLLFKYLNIGESSLGINAFSGELFNPEKIPYILDKGYGLHLPNSTLLKIIYELTIVDLGIGLQLIDYSEIGEEEIGSIYEALLDFQPKYVKKDTPTYHFILEEIDTERKGSGTYYTPKGLIDMLLKTALKPIVEHKLTGLISKDEKLKALLDLKVCDPACGGGSFLLASIDYLGKIYSQIESEEEFPEEWVLRESRRKILQNCIYGVDLNPMALELAKISLWLKASVKDKPLTFLNNHFKIGNSLIGYIRKQKSHSINLNAIKLIKGDQRTGVPDEDIEAINTAKNLIQKQKKIDLDNGKSSIQKTLFTFDIPDDYSEVAKEVFNMEENSLEQLKKKTKCYEELKRTNSWFNFNLQDNIETGIYFWSFLNKDFIHPPTDNTFFRIKQGNLEEDRSIISRVLELEQYHNFFNWHLEFPEVYQKKNSGFDCLLMNPPWEVYALQEMEFFIGKDDEIINTQNQSKRKKKILALKEKNQKLHQEFVEEFRNIKKSTNYFKNSGIYKLNSRGKLNLFALFIERARGLINKNGKIGCIVQSSILTGSSFRELFQDLISKNCLESAFDFINRSHLFPTLHTYQQFCLLTLTAPKSKENEIYMSFLTWDVLRLNRYLENYNEQFILEDEQRRNIMEGGSLLKFENDYYNMFNPNSKTSPMFKRIIDFEIVKKVYKRLPILIKYNEKGDVIENPWKIIKTNRSIFHMDKHSHMFYTLDDLIKKGYNPIRKGYKGGVWKSDSDTYLPIYGGSSIWIYDHRFNEIRPKKDKSKKRKSDYIKVSETEHQDPYYFYIPMYWVNEKDVKERYPKNWNYNWFISFRDISSSNLQRSFIVSVIPKFPNFGSLPTMTFQLFQQKLICFLANLSSIFFDYIARTKISGNHFTSYIVEQLPIFPPHIYDSKLFNEIMNRNIKLIYTSWDMQPFAKDFGLLESSPPFVWNSKLRHKIQSELDAIFAMMYNFQKNEISYVLDTFNVLRDKELKEFGEYRTKRLVLEAYDRFNIDPELGPLFRLEGVDLEK